MSEKIKPIAIHLPQFHPIPENDEWWGKGFTEWTNVTKAKPLFENHYQPHLPANLGFYDLRLEEARLAQEALAKSYGIYGFCYYHYWFTGKRLLHEPLGRKLNNPKEDFPFMMCWANEDWTRSWDGAEHEVLLKQDYSKEDDLHHINYLIKYFKDSRYIKVNEKPVFIVYRPGLFPNIEQTLCIWREEAIKAGLPGLYLGYAHKSDGNFLSSGFDFAFEFQPNFSQLPVSPKNKLLERVKNKIGFKKTSNLSIYDYGDYSKHQMQQPFQSHVYPGITPMWDNAARKKNAFILHDSTPKKYRDWLEYVIKKYAWQDVPENFIFLNAWNEWAEGNHLEPCQKWGTEYLEATREVLSK